MRIISGIYKGKQLKGFDIDGTRPTMDRVKESLFAMIQNEIKGKTCLDLYAGSGSLGMEALSNGAKECTLVDHNPKAIQAISENVRGMKQVTIIESDAFHIHNKLTKTFDLVFLDPPYQFHLMEKTLSYLLEHHLLKDDAIIVCESEGEIYSHPGFFLLKERQYGTKLIKILKKQS